MASADRSVRTLRARQKVRRVLLVGFMASGKSTVGAVLAERLGWQFLDFDREIEERTGSTIPELFNSRGETFFRALEADVARELLGRDRVVLASGGGWPTRPGRMESLGDDTLSVWLQVSAEIAVARSHSQGATRPLLSGGQPAVEATRLIEQRRPFYARATVHLDSECSTPDEMASVLEAQVLNPQARASEL